MGGGASKLDQRPFETIRCLGRGGFAVVYEVYHTKEKKRYAMKETNFSCVENQTKVLDMTLTELEALKMAGCHPFIVKLHSAFREGARCYLVLEELLGGDLRYHLRNFHDFREREVAYFVSCLGSALHHLHERGILHRDVKPENVMLGATGVPYLTDFGTAYLELEKRLPLCELSSGTLPYLSPESLTASRRHSYQNDFWSLGVLAYELLFNVRPFEKNCPRSYIYFVDNQYKAMWDRVSQLNVPTQAAPPSTPPDASSFSSFDFQQICNSINEADRLASLPYPDDHISLLSDGDVPVELKVPLPTFSFCGELLTPECRSMLSGLLEVRIPQRLGNAIRFGDFSRHPWLLSHDFSDPTAFGSFFSPFAPNLKQIRRSTLLKYGHASTTLPSNPASTSPLLSSEVEAKLARFSHPPPPLSSELTARASGVWRGVKCHPEVTSLCAQDIEFSNFQRSKSRNSLAALRPLGDPLI
jgi:serine/threonine protein kinase